MAYYLDFEGGTSSNEDVLIPEIYVNATEDFRFEIDFLTPSTNIINVLLGRSVSAGSNYALLWDNGDYSIRLSSTDSTRRGGITPDTRHKIVFRRENGVMYSSLDGAAETNDGSVAVLGRFDLIGYIGTSPTNRHFKGGLYDLKFYRGETLERHYNPTSSGGTGSVLPCDVASANDGTLRSFDGTANSWWIFYSEGGGINIDMDIASTTPVIYSPSIVTQQFIDAAVTNANTTVYSYEAISEQFVDMNQTAGTAQVYPFLIPEGLVVDMNQTNATTVVLSPEVIAGAIELLPEIAAATPEVYDYSLVYTQLIDANTTQSNAEVYEHLVFIRDANTGQTLAGFGILQFIYWED